MDSNVRYLAGLPYFDTGSGQPVLKERYRTGITDAHTHPGLVFGLARPVDLAASNRVRYYFPADGYAVDLARYSAYDVPVSVAKRCRRASVSQLVTRRGYPRTHTLTNLVAEMDRMGIDRSILLPIDIIRSRNTENLLTACRTFGSRIIPFCSVHPRRPDAMDLLRRFFVMGAAGLKIHPVIQAIRPSRPSVVMLCKAAGELGMPVLFHCGHSPVTGHIARTFTPLDEYRRLIEAVPGTTIILGHAGIDRYHEASHLAEKYPNVYLEMSGQPPSAIRHCLKSARADKMMFGTDWPYYPVALSLAKVLMATEGDDIARHEILHGTASRLFSGRA